MKIGLIQTQRLGDLIIALPIARWFVERGHEVYWPIRYDLLPPMVAAQPDVNFLPIVPKGDGEKMFAYYEPMQLLCEAGCEQIFPLYIHFEEFVDSGCPR